MPGCHGNLAAGTLPVLNFSSSINLQLNGNALCEKSLWANLFDEFMPTWLGAVFLRLSVLVMSCYLDLNVLYISWLYLHFVIIISLLLLLLHICLFACRMKWSSRLIVSVLIQACLIYHIGKSNHHVCEHKTTTSQQQLLLGYSGANPRGAHPARAPLFSEGRRF